MENFKVVCCTSLIDDGKSGLRLQGGGGRVVRDVGNSVKGPRFDPGLSHKDFAGVSENFNLCYPTFHWYNESSVRERPNIPVNCQRRIF